MIEKKKNKMRKLNNTLLLEHCFYIGSCQPLMIHFSMEKNRAQTFIGPNTHMFKHINTETSNLPFQRADSESN